MLKEYWRFQNSLKVKERKAPLDYFTGTVAVVDNVECITFTHAWLDLSL